MKSQHGYDAFHQSLVGITSLDHDGWSVIGNPAGLAELKSAAVLYAGHRHYFIRELDHHTVGVAIPGKASAGLFYHQTGDNRLINRAINIALGKNFGERLNMGIRTAVLLRRFAKPYSGDARVNVFWGSQLRISDKTSLSCLLNLPMLHSGENNFSKDTEYGIHVGLSYHPSNHLTLCLESVSSEQVPLGLRLASSYSLTDVFQFRLGYDALRDKISFGTSVSLRNGLSLLTAISYDAVPGFNLFISLQWSILKKIRET